jgi:hypothetical protein
MGAHTVVLFSKDRTQLNVSTLTDASSQAPYLRFAESLKERLHRPNGTLRPEHDFVAHMGV